MKNKENLQQQTTTSVSQLSEFLIKSITITLITNQTKLKYRLSNLVYIFNFQEGNLKSFIDMVLRFDKVVSDIVNGIKSGVDLFKEIISGKGIKGVINDFIAALEALPEKASIFCSLHLL